MYYSPITPDTSLRPITPDMSSASIRDSMVSLSSGSTSVTDILTTNPTPRRHESFWMYDGSIVLHVQNTLFRVHQTILAAHSEVFATLFTVPQPEGEDMIDGCHVVELHDHERDFEDLLAAVYRPDHFDTLPIDADLDTVMIFIGGILRLSTKYVVRYLRQRCISLLLTKLPPTFEAYEAKSALTSPPGNSPAERYRSDTVMRAIRLAQDNNVLEALPYAYYCVSRFPHKRLLKDAQGISHGETRPSASSDASA
ncbi:hypothetical protein NLJ89_g5998 [Agrocybe chaxingu]|uniref:BTB domain-containing protein n=1 Tax=Agrocybe chaxingu TaxID=84603 RepID=A0A9W8K067_9AGAR|nr:hypothetical protein NLJ89_g5998 [Agrocybe chaxingu]